MAYGQKYQNYPFADRFGQWPVDERQEGIRRLIEEFDNSPQFRERTLAFMGPQETLRDELQRFGPGGDSLSRMPTYDPGLLVPRGSIPQGEGESPPMSMSPRELEEYGDSTPGGGSPYSRPLQGENIDIGPGPGSTLEDIENTKRQRMQELIDEFHRQAEEEAGDENFKGY